MASWGAALRKRVHDPHMSIPPPPHAAHSSVTPGLPPAQNFSNHGWPTQSISAQALPAGARTAPGVAARARWLVAGLLGIFGGWAVVNTQFVTVLLPYGNPEFDEKLAVWLRIAFALLAVVAAMIFAPGPVPLRIVAVAVVVAGLAIALTAQAGILTGWLDLGPVVRWFFSAQPFFLLLGSLAWLIACRARWWAYFGLLLTLPAFAVTPILITASVSSSIGMIVLDVVSLVAATVVLLLSRPRPPAQEVRAAMRNP